MLCPACRARAARAISSSRVTMSPIRLRASLRPIAPTFALPASVGKSARRVRLRARAALEPIAAVRQTALDGRAQLFPGHGGSSALHHDEAASEVRETCG